MGWRAENRRGPTFPADSLSNAISNIIKNNMLGLTFKLATEPWEFEAIHRLNYKTFVGEIPQHPRNAEHRLVDKFHHENSYVISLCGNELVGMVCLRGNRPFSLDLKLPKLDSYLPAGRSVCEIRLLVVEKRFRHSKVTIGLLGMLAQHAISLGYDCAIISGAIRQLKFYRHIGFVPFGPLVGSAEATFQPMCLSLEAFDEHSAKLLGGQKYANREDPPANFLPGSVVVAPEVRAAFQELPRSHRSRQFVSDLLAVKRCLCELVNASQVEILLGSGTLANEVIAGQLSIEKTPGLILSNGEFGERLVDHARRHGLVFGVLRLEWGLAFKPDELKEFLDQNPDAKWLWAVHCETSTGVLNDLSLFKRLCDERGLKLCLDSISSIGVVPVDLRGVFLASGVSGKGLASYSGLSLVFYHHSVRPEPYKLPRYLDLGLYAAKEGTPFTQSSNLLYALKAAAEYSRWNHKFHDLVTTAFWLRAKLRSMGYHILAQDSVATPAVITLVLPDTISSDNFGRRLEKAGFLLSYCSEYLLRRNWVQICFMGEYTRESLEALLTKLKQLCPLQRREPILLPLCQSVGAGESEASSTYKDA